MSPYALGIVITGRVQPDYTQTLRLFRRRAELLLECELARRDDAMTLGTTLGVDLVAGENNRMVFSGLRMTVPPREQVGYAITLIRPFTLQRDHLAWTKILDALDACCPQTDTSASLHLADLRAAWDGYPYRRARYQVAPISPGGPGPRLDLWDDEISHMLLYGDLVHGDDYTEMLDALGDQRVLSRRARWHRTGSSWSAAPTRSCTGCARMWLLGCRRYWLIRRPRMDLRSIRLWRSTTTSPACGTAD